MMFLARSVFWLGCVYSAMPFDGAETARAVDAARFDVARGAISLAQNKLGQDIAAAPALRVALDALDAPAMPQSFDGLTKADRALKWRGPAPATLRSKSL